MRSFSLPCGTCWDRTFGTTPFGPYPGSTKWAPGRSLSTSSIRITTERAKRFLVLCRGRHLVDARPVVAHRQEDQRMMGTVNTLA